MQILKPVALALAAGSPFVGAMTHHAPVLDRRIDLASLCESQGATAGKPSGPEALYVAAFAEASAVYGEQAGKSLFCLPRGSDGRNSSRPS